MKCDELKSFNSERIYWAVEQVEREAGDIDNFHLDDSQFYLKSEVDAAIAELKAKLEAKELEFANLKEDALNTDKACEKWLQLSRKQAMENRRLKRALYKACANWAKSERYTEATWHGDEHREELWANVQAKCLNKAEEFK